MQELTVSTSADSGPGSLREAIEHANEANGTVRVSVAQDGAPLTIRPVSPLPALTFSGALEGPVEVDGAIAAAGSGLEVAGEDLTVRGVTLFGWALDGIHVRAARCTITEVVASGNARYGVLVDEGADDARIVDCRIGTDPSGSTPVPNGHSGIRVIQAGRCVIERNLLSGNVQYGLEIVGPRASEAIVRGNSIGTDASGRAALPNQRTGILVYSASFVRIGGATPHEANVVSGNNRAGITIDGAFSDLPEYPYSGLGHCHHNVVAGNLIGLDSTGERPLGNLLRGVLLNHTQDNTVIDNVIGGNSEDGVLVLGPEAHADSSVVPSGNVISRNRIGVTAAGEPCPNGRHGILVRHARDNRVGDGTPQGRNTIAFNSRRGVVFAGTGARTNHLEDNDLFANVLGDFHQPRE